MEIKDSPMHNKNQYSQINKNNKYFQMVFYLIF